MFGRAISRIGDDIHQHALTVLAAGIILRELIGQVVGGVSWSSLLLIPAGFAVATRTRYPLGAFFLQLSVTVLAMIIGNPSALACIGVTQVCLISIAVLRGRLPIIVAAVCGSLVLIAGVALLLPGDRSDALVVTYVHGLFAWTLVSVGIGVAIRAQRRYLRAVQELASQEIERQELLTRQVVVEERLRIARELHDSVAHHVAVVGMLTGLARTRLRDAPDDAADALLRSQDSTRAILHELQAILGVLRDQDLTETGGGPYRPDPGLDDVDHLVRSFRDIGLDVRFEHVGLRTPLPASVISTVFWLLRESITNAQKHGEGAVEVRMDQSHDWLRIDVLNRIAASEQDKAQSIPTSGYGLIGMEERVQAVGGTLIHESRNGTFRLSATLPLNPRNDEAAMTDDHIIGAA